MALSAGTPTSAHMKPRLQGPPPHELGHDSSTRTPAYLKDMDSGARVTSGILWQFEALLEHSGAVSGMKGAALKLSGMLYARPVLYKYQGPMHMPATPPDPPLPSP